jgi:hypothetical protein
MPERRAEALFADRPRTAGADLVTTASPGSHEAIRAMMAMGMSWGDAMGSLKATMEPSEYLRACLDELNGWRDGLLALGRDAIIDDMRGGGGHRIAIAIADAIADRPWRKAWTEGEITTFRIPFDQMAKVLGEAGVSPLVAAACVSAAGHEDAHARRINLSQAGIAAACVARGLGLPDEIAASFSFGALLAQGEHPIRLGKDDWFMPIQVRGKVEFSGDAACVVCQDTMEMTCRDATRLPDRVIVMGSLIVSGTSIGTIPDGMVIDGALTVSRTPITGLPEGLTVRGALAVMSCPEFRSFPKRATILPDSRKGDARIVVSDCPAWDGHLPRVPMPGVSVRTDRHADIQHANWLRKYPRGERPEGAPTG